MTSEPKLTPEEQRVYDLIKRETKSSGGIKQVLVRRHLELKDIDPKVVTQIVRKLIDMGLVEREVVNNGDKRYLCLKG
uniref:MarR family transcriptional regulator n=1 Tax=Ignisphaera aggregans TaxID=334771 RepID=A0A7C2ZRN0_9CREN